MAKIIAHRGASGSALENSTEAVRKALAQDVDAVEFDVHLTADDKVVVIHDRHTARVANKVVLVRSQTLAQLRTLSLNDGQKIPTLDEVLDIVCNTPVSIDVKDDGMSKVLFEVIRRHPAAHVTFVSFRHRELSAIRRISPDIPTYVLEHLRPFDIVRTARRLQATGIGLNMWLMNPLTYVLARRHNLRLYVYTVNRLWLARFLLALYPNIDICSDHPERLASLRSNASRRRKKAKS